MPRMNKYHQVAHFNPDPDDFGPFYTECKCNKGGAHFCKSNCSRPNCQHRLDKKLPKTLDEAAMLDYIIELDRIMPQKGFMAAEWGRPTHPIYECRICGSSVSDRARHLDFHQDKTMRNIIGQLFGGN